MDKSKKHQEKTTKVAKKTKNSKIFPWASQGTPGTSQGPRDLFFENSNFFQIFPLIFHVSLIFPIFVTSSNSSSWIIYCLLCIFEFWGSVLSVFSCISEFWGSVWYVLLRIHGSPYGIVVFSNDRNS